jgi:hypothetical protein
LLTLGAAALAAAPLGAQRRSSVITAEEIERVGPNAATAYDIVQSLRPQWLRPRDIVMSNRPDEPVQAARVHVYLDDLDVGYLDYLKTIPAQSVLELRWLSANQAASRYGPTEGPGIVVTLRR